ncbi:unnamed protein product [Meloidogyne enterolobii]|uniref:Uncharacterized protein n=1 Tax=Meloidogyne enterolobii TaxID=390850 RepID=A0ACB1AAU5_MELEN
MGYTPSYRRAVTSFKLVESGTPWYGSMHLDDLNRIISECPGFEHFERSYSFAVRWPTPEKCNGKVKFICN